LARALAGAGVCVVSGLAAGADRAAHEGAMEATVGTLAVPARGLLELDLSPCLGEEAPMTCLGLDRPDAPFTAGLAIRRNDVIAALGDGLVLVASDLKGGSAYAVRWAIAQGAPLWCLTKGHATPPGNLHLTRHGLARPLDAAAPPEDWLAEILPALEGYRNAPPRPAAAQDDLFARAEA
jgi:DNA processing protein